MLNLSRVEVQTLATQFADNMLVKRNQFNAVCTKINRLHTKKNQVELEIAKLSAKIRAAQQALILTDKVSAKLLAIRHKIVQKMETIKREDITIAKQKNLQQEIKELKAKLQKKCRHHIVYQIDGYEGDHLHEYENRRPEERLCIVCGLYETGKIKVSGDRVGTSFEILVEAEHRMFEEQYGNKDLRTCDIWVNLAVVLKPFEESIAKTLNS